MESQPREDGKNILSRQYCEQRLVVGKTLGGLKSLEVTCVNGGGSMNKVEGEDSDAVGDSTH